MPDDPLPILDPLIDDPPPLSSDILPEEMEGFDEAAYLIAFPDVLDAIERRELASGLDHYRMAGRAEGRLQRPEYRQQIEAPPLDACVTPELPGLGSPGLGSPGLGSPGRGSPGLGSPGLGSPGLGSPIPNVHEAASPFAGSTPAASVDAIVVSESGAVFFVGWADDRRDPLVEIRLRFASGAERRFRRFPRLRRLDVEEALGSAAAFHYGVWTFAATPDRIMSGQIMPGRIAGHGACAVAFRFASGAVTDLAKTPTLASDTALRDTVMGHFSAVKYHGNRWVESFASLDGEAGDALVAFNRIICDRITSGAVAERFGPRRRRVKGSIVVPLYGRHQYFFLQSSAYANLPGIEDYEFIYVVNSPELIEVLQREARIAETAYGLTQTLVFLPDNAGFGGANNVALRFAQGSRILCVNPDVFPLDPAWARRHTDLVAALPEAQTRLFGTTLYYDDGSLMHGGMHFESDISITNRPDGIARRALLRVEHYGKGAPAWATQFTRSRPVPAVSGAFISADRAWFEQLGGFNEDYIFGHYEDADLCLKSLQAGFPAWMHDIRMWHLEGKGSTRRPPHEGGSLLNRWFFSRKWEAFLTPDLLGKTPRHPALQVEEPPVAVAVPAGTTRRMRAR